MRLEDALRWQRLWWFLSLDIVRDFSLELWLPSSVMDVQTQLRSRIDPNTDLPSYASDPRAKAYRMLVWFKDLVGDESLNNLIRWQRSIFVQGGQDRVEEFVWDALAHELFQRSAELDPQEAFRPALKQFHDLKAVGLGSFGKRLPGPQPSKLSTWDQKAIEAEEASLDVVINTVTSVCSSNVFVSSWHQACTSRGPAFLAGIFEVSQKLASNDTSGRLLFSADTLPFPSSWEFSSAKSCFEKPVGDL